MRQAFTMIELIFVIVILGILATVAIPRLSATRDDAHITAMAHDISTGATEIASYATAKGFVPDDLSLASNSMMALENSGDAVLAPKKAVIRMGEVDDCITIEINSTAEAEVLNVILVPHQSDPLCGPLQKIFRTDSYPMILRGQSVSY